MQAEQTEPQKRNNDNRDNRDRKRRTDKADRAPKNPEQTEGAQDDANVDGAKKNERPDKKDRQPRKPRFVAPENWKSEADASVTIDSKIPNLPNETERLQRPNYNKLKADLDQAEADMDKHYRKIDNLKEDAKNVRNAQKDKNSSTFDELKKLNEDRKVHSTALAENKQLKQQYTDKINNIDDKLREVEKKSFSGKLMRKKELTDLIKQREEEFANTKKTSAEEKKMSDEINRLRAMIKAIPEFEKLKDERQKYTELLKEIGKKNKAEFDKMQKVSDRITELRGRLDENAAKAKQEKAEKGEEGEKKEGEKKVRVLSEAEQEIEKLRQQQYDQIKLIKDRKQQMRDKYEADWTAYEKQQHELDKIYYMQKLQKNLKREEREKRRKEEDEKFKLADEEKAKEALQFKYADEINLCEQLTSHLEDLKPDKKQNKTFVPNSEITAHNVNADQLKQENLVYIKPKKFDESENVVNKKKNKQAKGKQAKKEAPVAVGESDKLNIHFDTLHLFNDVKVAPPTTYGQIDNVIKQLNEKKEYYIALREKEIESALANPVAAEKKEAKEGDAAEEKTEEQQQTQAREQKNARPQKKVDLKDDDFPEL